MVPMMHKDTSLILGLDCKHKVLDHLGANHLRQCKQKWCLAHHIRLVKLGTST